MERKKDKGKKNPSSPSTSAKKELDKIVEKAENPTADQRSGLWKDLLAQLITTALCVAIVQLAPLPGYDVKKPNNNTSFLSLYFSGGLDKVEHITQMLIAAAFSVLLDIGVVAFHVLYPPHPKFVMITARRFSIFLHLVSGITEILSGILAFTVGDPKIQLMCALTMSAVSITHALTAYYQTRLVFGAKGVMVPGYTYAITIHITNAVRLYYNPTSVVHLLFTYLVLHIYVWCRFFIPVFRMFNLFVGYQYTVAITLSGALLFPYAMGPVGNFGMLFVVLFYCFVEMVLADKTENLNEKLFREHERYALITQESLNEWKNSLHATHKLDSDKKMAKEVFDRRDITKSGKLEVTEIYDVISTMGLKTVTVSKVLEIADADHDGALSFDEFYRFIWNIGSIHERIKKLPKAQAFSLNDNEKAKIVFDMLDIDSNGYISLVELDMLLTQWGMPLGEANTYLNTNLKGKKKISFDVFQKQLKPIWNFATQFIFE